MSRDITGEVVDGIAEQTDRPAENCDAEFDYAGQREAERRYQKSAVGVMTVRRVARKRGRRERGPMLVLLEVHAQKDSVANELEIRFLFQMRKLCINAAAAGLFRRGKCMGQWVC